MSTEVAQGMASRSQIAQNESKAARGVSVILLKAIVWVFLLIWVVLTLYPVLFAFLGGLKSNDELMNSATLIPHQWVWNNFVQAWQQANFAQYTWNSLFISVLSTLLTLIAAAMGSYALARRSFPGNKFILGLLAATMFVSIGAITYRPLYDLMKSVGLHSSLWSVVLVYTGTHLAFNVFLLERFVRGIPRTIDEAATIDGCGFFRTFWQIILPLLGPGLAVVALFSFRDSWNQYILPLIFTMSKPELWPLTVGVVSLKYAGNAASQWNLMLAGSAMSMIPVIVVYLFANKAFISGMTSGAVKE